MAGLRRRAIRAILAVVAAVLVAAIGGSCGTSTTARPTGAAPATTGPSATSTTTPTTVYGPGDPVPGQDVRAASFVDLRDGFGTAGATIVSTVDGGLTWSALASVTRADHGSNLGTAQSGSGIL